MKYLKEIIPYIIIIVVVVLIRNYVITPVRVDGESMYSTLYNDEILLLNKMDRSFDRMDIIVIKYNDDKLIKRIIGLPGEHIAYKDSKLYIDGMEVKEDFLLDKNGKLEEETTDFDLTSLGYDTIPDGYYFVVGDNRDNSLDSRYIGLIKEDDITGTTSIALFPFNKFGKIK